MASKDVTRILYRSILRWVKAAEGVPFEIRDKHIAEVFPQLPNAQLGLQDSDAVEHLARQSFRNNMTLHESDVEEAVEAAFTGLRILNSHYAEQIKSMRENRELHSKRNGILYPVGQVFLHRRHGYAGVVYGWDHICGHGPDWAEKMGVKYHQPFYQVLPDEDDCQRLYGSIRITKYVAEENIMPIVMPRRITHRLLENFFKSYTPSQMRYIPREQLQFQFPDDYSAEDEISCREDTNLLKGGGDETSPYRPIDHVRRGIEDVRNSLAAFKPD